MIRQDARRRSSQGSCAAEIARRHHHSLVFWCEGRGVDLTPDDRSKLPERTPTHAPTQARWS